MLCIKTKTKLIMKHLKPMSARTSSNHPPKKSNLIAKGASPSFLPSFLLTILIAGMLFACKKDSGLTNDSTSSKFYFAKNSEDLVDVVDRLGTL